MRALFHSIRQKFILSLGIVFFAVIDSNPSSAQELQFGGYLQAMPLRIATTLPEPEGDQTYFEYRMQGRLNLRADFGRNFSLHAQGRARLFAGDLVQDFPVYADFIDTDDGFVNLSWMPVRSGDVLLHLLPDRLYADWSSGDWNIRAGRQRINWGINMLSNPNDVFNIYSVYEFDYPERPGTDALRIRYFIDWDSRLEIAAAPSRAGMRESVVAALYGFGFRGYDVQLITGWYRNRLALGGGWAGSMGGTGLKGELMLFRDVEAPESGRRENSFVAAVSADHMFSNGLFAIAEVLYNSSGGTETFGLLSQPLSADNPSISAWQLSSTLQQNLNPLTDAALTLITYPDERGAFISPSVTRSLTQNTDASLLAQFFLGASDSPLADAGSLVLVSVKWDF